MRSRQWAANLDMYRKVPADLLEGTKRGSIISYAALTIMLTLTLMETISFMSQGRVGTNVALDSNPEKKIRVNFNITMMDLKCDYAVIDVVSALGTEQNVTKHLTKFSLDADGVRDRYVGRNKEQDDIILADSLVMHSIEELHENGEDAISLDSTTLEFAKEEYEFLFVDFYASWCSHCKHLAPTWETLAEIMNEAAMVHFEASFQHQEEGHEYSEEEYNEALKVHIPVTIAKVDCVVHKQLCSDQQIWAYPTLRLFVRGDFYSDYLGDRTVVEMAHWLAEQEEFVKNGEEDAKYKIDVADEVARGLMGVNETREEMNEPPKRPTVDTDVPDDDYSDVIKSDEQKQWIEKMNRYRRRQKNIWREEDHPGCQISGFLWVDRVPGNFHIQARSASHDIAAHMTNVSHEIHHLSFGNPSIGDAIRRKDIPAPEGYERSLNPMDGNVYVNHNEHEAFHHYMKVVTTVFSDDPYINTVRDMNEIISYQVLSSSQLSFYRNDIVPEAKFSYDPSPIAVFHHREYEKHWYDYITSLMAIIGGTFTVFGMLENSIHAASKKRR